MIGLGTGVRVYLAAGVTDMRKGIAGLGALAQNALGQNPASGSVFVFRGRKGDRVKLLYWDGQGFCLYYKVLERGHFPWPRADAGAVHLTSAQLSMLWGEERSAKLIERSGGSFEGTNARSAGAGPGRIDWRRPRWTSAPTRM